MISARAFVAVAVLVFGLALAGDGIASSIMGGAQSLGDTFALWFFFNNHLYGDQFFAYGDSYFSTVVVGGAAFLLRPWIVRWVFADTTYGQPFVARMDTLVPVALALAGIGLVVSAILVWTTPYTLELSWRSRYPATAPDARMVFVASVRGGMGVVFLLLASVWFRVLDREVAQ